MASATRGAFANDGEVKAVGYESVFHGEICESALDFLKWHRDGVAAVLTNKMMVIEIRRQVIHGGLMTKVNVVDQAESSKFFESSIYR